MLLLLPLLLVAVPLVKDVHLNEAAVGMYVREDEMMVVMELRMMKKEEGKEGGVVGTGTLCRFALSLLSGNAFGWTSHVVRQRTKGAISIYITTPRS